MYTLRRISSAGVEMNHALGDGYTVVNRETSYEEFSRDFKTIFGKDHVADLDEKADEDTKKVYAFVGTAHGERIYSLYKNQSNYIMTDSGRTLSNLSYRN